MSRLYISKKPYYHIHLDGKIIPNQAYTDFAKRLGFFEMPFSKAGDSPPITHLTKKYRISAEKEMRADFAFLKVASDQFKYSGYIECEKVISRCSFSNPLILKSPEFILFPFKFSNRLLNIDADETFKVWDMHITISSDSDQAVINALDLSGLLKVRPLYENSLVYTAQFSFVFDIEQKIAEIRDCVLSFIKNNRVHIRSCVFKIEQIIDFYISNVGVDNLPKVVRDYELIFK